MSITATVSRLDSFRYWRGNEDATTEDWLKDLFAPPNHRMDVGAAFQTVLEKLAANPGGEVDACEADGISFNFKCDAAIPQPNPVYGRKDYGQVLVSGRAGIVDGKRVEVFKTTKRFEAERRQDDYQWRLLLDLFDADEFVWNVFVIAPNNPDETSYNVVDYHRLTATRYPGLHDDCVSLINDYHGIMSSIPEEDMFMASTGRGKAKANALPKETAWITITADILQQTEPTAEHDGAILVNCGDVEKLWIPLSVCKFSGEVGDVGVEVDVQEWFANQEGLYDGQGKARAQTKPDQEGAADAATTPTEPTEAPADGPAPACRFKGDVTSLDADSIVLAVTNPKGKEKAFTYSKADLRFEGDDVADLQVGYKGIDFVIGWDIAVESKLAKHLKLKAPNPAPESAPAQEQPAAAPAPEVDEDAPKHEAKPYKSKLRTETVRATVELTPEEKNECAKRITDALSRRTDLKEKASYYSSKAREAEKEAYKASEVFESGEEERDITCDVIGDFNTMELVYVESEWPHREIQRRHMTDKDRQLLLPIDPPAQAKPEPEAVAAQPAEPEHVCETCRSLGDGNACEPCTIVNGDTSVDIWKPANNEPRCTTCVHHGADYPDDCGTCQDDPDSLVNWKPLHPCFAPSEQEEPETVTLYGEVLEQRENETVFRVHYGDDDNTVAEFTIPNEQFQLPAFADTTSTQDFITLTLAYAVEAGIVAAPEENATPARTCETCIHYDCTNLSCEGPWDDECSTDNSNPAFMARWEPLAEPEKACASCSHLDAAADDNACEGCGDGLSNFTPLEQPHVQGQPESIGAEQ